MIFYMRGVDEVMTVFSGAFVIVLMNIWGVCKYR